MSPTGAWSNNPPAGGSSQCKGMTGLSANRKEVSVAVSVAGGSQEREEKQDRWGQRGTRHQVPQGLVGTTGTLALTLRKWTGAA